MSETLWDPEWEGSVLADLDAGGLLDVLSLGIIVLDAQLCAIYANAMAESVLATRMQKLRGRPFAPFLPQSQRFLEAVHRALEKSEPVAFELAGGPWSPSGGDGMLNLRVTPLCNELMRMYLLLELRPGRSPGPSA